MREVIKLGLILLVITSIAAIVLAFSNNATIGIIANVEAEANDNARKEVLPQAVSFKPLEEASINEIKGENSNILEIFIGYDSSESIVGYTIKTATPGYGGDVQVITGINSDGKTTGMKVISHQETPGLGANSTKPEFQNQFKDKSVDKEITVVKTAPKNDNEVQALTGATISSNAVKNGVNTAIEIFNSKLSK